MWLEFGRRITMIILIVAVATGLGVPAVHAEIHHGQLIATAAISMDNSGTCAHEGCGSTQQADMQGTCFAPCIGVSVLPATATIIHFSVGHDVLAPALDQRMADRAIPPDLHPPKSTT